jgi:hypothetical protein
MGHKRQSAPQQKVSSFDHIIGKLLETKRYFDAQRLSGLEVYHQLKLDRLMYWEVSRLRAAENFSGVGPHLLIHIHIRGPIGSHNSPGHRLQQKSGSDANAAGVSQQTITATPWLTSSPASEGKRLY